MKFTTPNGSKVESTVLMIAGLAIGAMASRAGFAAIHEDKAGLDTAAAKKQTLVKAGKRVAIIGASGYAAAGINGSDNTSVIVKNIALGSALVQVVDGAKDALAGNSKINASGTKLQRIAAASLGLGCPCESQSLEALPLNRPHRKHRRLNSPALVEAYENGYALNAPFGEYDPLQAALDSGMMAN